MAHNLCFNEQTGDHSFFSVKQKAWHGLGRIVQDYPTSREAIEYAGLNYEVQKRPLFTYGSDITTGNEGGIAEGTQYPVADYECTVRTDNNAVLGVVGKDYQVVQNVDAFSFFDSIVGGDGIMYETAGALGKGERIFITAKLPDYIKVGSNDLIEKYLFLTTSHDGSGSITVAFTPVRIVCANTLNAAMNAKTNALKIRHTASAKERLEQAHRIMGISNSLSNDMQELFNQWAKVRITDKELKRLIQLAMAPNREVLKNLKDRTDESLSTRFNNVVDSAYQYALSNPTQQMETTKGTLFGAYNSITGYFQNVKDFKSSEAKVTSLFLNGSGQMKVQTAFNYCMDYAKSGADALNMN